MCSVSSQLAFLTSEEKNLELHVSRIHTIEIWKIKIDRNCDHVKPQCDNSVLGLCDKMLACWHFPLMPQMGLSLSLK